MSDGKVLSALAIHFTMLSLVAVGGANTVLPDMHRFAVDVNGWMTDSEFAELFAIARASPGPNVLIVSLIGWKAAGLLGALVATGGMCGPSCLLAYTIERTWSRFRAAPWRIAVQAGLAPVTIGLVLASGYIVTRAADGDWFGFAITAATVALVMATRLNPLWILGGAALLGIAIHA